MKKVCLTLMIACVLISLCLFACAEAEKTYPWIEYVPEGERIEDVVGEFEMYNQYLDLFDEYTYINPDEAIGDMTYYLYDPVKHGADPDGEYAICMWLHGYSNSYLGKNAIIAAGASQMPDSEIQKEIGGMYVLMPLANESTELWSEKYNDSLYGILSGVIEEHKITGPTLTAGFSMGGMMMDHWLREHADVTNAGLWIASALPTVEEAKAYSDMGIKMWLILARHDESGFYTSNFGEAGPEIFDGIENLEITLLDWNRTGNKAIVGMCAGGYIGQHCISTQVNRNLIFDDGTPDDPTHPEGVVGWFRDTIAALKQ